MMTDSAPGPTPRVYWLAAVAAIGLTTALYLTLTEPFGGTPLGLAGRVAGIIASLLIVLALAAHGRWRGPALVAGVGLGIGALVLIVIGRIH